MENQPEDIQSVPATPVSASPAKLVGPIQLLSETWDFFIGRFATLVGITVFPVLLAYLLGLALGLNGDKYASAPPFFGLPAPVMVVGGLALFLSTVIIIAWSQTALLVAIESPTPLAVFEAYHKGWSKIFSYLWLKILTGFIVLGGFMLLIVPGIIFAVWFSLVLFVLVVEDERGMQALLKSKEYVRGYFGPVFGRLLFISVIVWLAALIFTVVMKAFPLSPFTSSLPGLLVSLVGNPFILVFLFRIYTSLRAVRGSVTPPSGGKQKGVFVALGILGLLIIPFILFSVVLVSLNSARIKAQTTAEHADLKQLQAYLELYRSKKGSYPSSLDALVPEYISAPPTDYSYSVQDGKSYELCPFSLPSTPENCVSSK